MCGGSVMQSGENKKGLRENSPLKCLVAFI